MPMNIQDIRRAVLRTLISTHHASARQFAGHIKKPDGQINDMLSEPPRKAFGERVARAIENAYPLPPGFFDDPANASKQHIKESIEAPQKIRESEQKVIYGQFNATISSVIELMQEVDEETQRDILGAVRMAATEYRIKLQKSTLRAGNK